jgi:hypothetical protein
MHQRICQQSKIIRQRYAAPKRCQTNSPRVTILVPADGMMIKKNPYRLYCQSSNHVHSHEVTGISHGTYTTQQISPCLSRRLVIYVTNAYTENKRFFMELCSVLCAVTHVEPVLVQGGTKSERFFQRTNLVPSGSVFQLQPKVVGSIWNRGLRVLHGTEG